MDILEAIHTRRSIRKYTAEDVSPEDVREMLKCAMLAPSARNEQPWQFVIVRDAAMRKILSTATKYTGMVEHAPVAIIVCGDLALEKSEGFWPQDCAAAIENLMLAARGLNLGTVWCGLHPVKDRSDYVRKVLGIPENVVPLGMVAVGHPDQPFSEADRFREDRLHYEKW